MLILNDEHRHRQALGVSRSGIRTVASRFVRAYLLNLSDDGRLAVYHAACTAQLATEILVDLYIFFRPPCPL